MRFSFVLLMFLYSTSVCFSQVRPYKATVYDTSSTGYYFLSSIRAFGTKGINSQMILDKNGKVVFFMPFAPEVITFDFKMQPNGMISYSDNGKYYLMDSTFTIKDSVSCQNGYATDIHELQILPNGHYLLLGAEYTTVDLSAYPYFANGAYGSPTATVISNVIQELDNSKNVVFEWHTKDHFSFDSVDPFWLNDSATVDWTHSNALEMDYDGNILLSSRHFNEITKINRSDSSIMWRMGGKYNEFTFLNEPYSFYGQHDCRRIANGHLTLYDNANHVTPHAARALEYELDEVNKIADLKWSSVYDTAMYSRATGNVQRLPNSNTLINYGITNKNNVCFNVVDSIGNKVFELAFDDTLISYRAFNYPTLPFGFNRPQISCFESAGIGYLDAGAGYSSYHWSNGETTQVIQITSPDTFTVYVPYGEGFITSPKRIVTDISQTCASVDVSEISLQSKLFVIPNPASDHFTLSGYRFQTNGIPEFYNVVGEQFYPSFNGDSGKVNCENLVPGFYFIKMNNQVIKFIKI